MSRSSSSSFYILHPIIGSSCERSCRPPNERQRLQRSLGHLPVLWGPVIVCSVCPSTPDDRRWLWGGLSCWRQGGNCWAEQESAPCGSMKTAGGAGRGVSVDGGWDREALRTTMALPDDAAAAGGKISVTGGREWWPLVVSRSLMKRREWGHTSKVVFLKSSSKQRRRRCGWAWNTHSRV